jgi:ubiquinone/menaquinone biosynthesis C-methylase UbiE
LTPADYDEIAGWYDEAVRSGPLGPFHEWIIPIVLDLAGEVEGQRICDLACGQGIVSRRLADMGAQVVGVDVSAGMLDLARGYEREEPRGITYIRGDAMALDVVADRTFDGVVCSMALIDIPDLAATLRTVSRILRPRGWFVFSVVHPVLQTPGSPRWVIEEGEIVGLQLRDYFAEGFWRRDKPEGLRGRVGAHHRTLSTYVNELSRSGLTIECLLEPRASGRFAETAPVYQDVPVALVVRCEKPAELIPDQEYPAGQDQGDTRDLRRAYLLGDLSEDAAPVDEEAGDELGGDDERERARYAALVGGEHDGA